MTPRAILTFAIVSAATVAVAFVNLVPTPFLFSGSDIALSALFAALACLTFLAWLPEGWLWSDAERLAHAFKAHHQLSGLAAETALIAISDAHNRAERLRADAAGFHAELKPSVLAAADRLDASAREIFYEPDRLRALRIILKRSELIADATRAHKTLRARDRNNETTVSQSRDTLLGALDALEEAFASSDLQIAKGHLDQVKIASSVAEDLLRPRQPFRHPKEGDHT